MAFRGARGGRGARGARGRGGRGRGRAATFESSRIADSRDEEAILSTAEQSSEESQNEEDSLSSSDSEDEGTAVNKPYGALLGLFKVDEHTNGPPQKRRKLESAKASTEREKLDASAGEDSGEFHGQDKGGGAGFGDLEQRDPSDDEDDVEGEVSDDDDDDEEDLEHNERDPFDRHVNVQDDADLAQTIKSVTEKGWKTSKALLSNNLRAITAYPHDKEEPTGLSGVSSTRGLMLKRKLLESAEKHIKRLDSLESVLASRIFDYQDMSFNARTASNASTLRTLYSLHAINHVMKTRDRVLKNNSRSLKDSSADIDLRDQGFTRPKVLIIVSTRQACVRVMDSIAKLYPADQHENKKRFLESFDGVDDPSWETKPEDFQELFGGNDDDNFRLGVKFTRKTIKYFSQFYNSDLILASPLGLRMAMDKEDGKKQDYDFLSSIEVTIVDHADALLMQNWEHVEYIFEHLNLQPKEAHGCDFSRVRSWYLDGHAKYMRQTLMFTAFATPEINSLFSTHMLNISGKVRIMPVYDGAISSLPLPIPVQQTFTRYEVASPAKDPDARFKYFTNAVLPSLIKQISSSGGRNAPGILVFIPSYLDFVRVRNYFATSTQTENISFGAISEYTAVRDVARARSHFLTGRHSILLYTERIHHFRRYPIRGVKRIVMYGLPENPEFYKEIMGFLALDPGAAAEIAAGPGARILFSKFDALKVERTIGTERIGKLFRETQFTVT
ncbi:rRNA-binding ribosome biosynthesis protein utp25 [Ascosphaera pollenicola]|nr:rRNA-binding ribosome biosynthesis protein utp25 [Ascosphaera pollenicola]